MINEVNDMTEKDLDVAIEKCERIMEFDTRTLKNPESENGYIFEKVYDLLEFLRQFQFETGGMDDTISRRAMIDAVDGVDWYHHNKNGEMVHGANSDKHQAWYKAEDIYKAIEALPSAQPGWIPVTEKPIEVGQYIVTLKDDKEVWTDIAEWNPTFGGRWQAEFFDCEYHDIDNVVAWQPLPTPYREGGQDEQN